MVEIDEKKCGTSKQMIEHILAELRQELNDSKNILEGDD